MPQIHFCQRIHERDGIPSYFFHVYPIASISSVVQKNQGIHCLFLLVFVLPHLAGAIQPFGGCISHSIS